MEWDWQAYPILHLDLNVQKYEAKEDLYKVLNRHLELWEQPGCCAPICRRGVCQGKAVTNSFSGCRQGPTVHRLCWSSLQATTCQSLWLLFDGCKDTVILLKMQGKG